MIQESPWKGRKKLFRPFQGLGSGPGIPRARALGYYLSPLRAEFSKFLSTCPTTATLLRHLALGVFYMQVADLPP